MCRPRNALGQCGEQILWQCECSPNFPHCRPPTKRLIRCNASHSLLPILVVYIVDYLIAPIAGKVDIDIWALRPLKRHKSFEQQPPAHRVNICNIQAIRDGRVGRGTASSTANPAASREANNIPDNKKVIDITQFANDL